MKKLSFTGLAALLLGNCTIYHGRVNFPESGYSVILEAQPETDDRPEVYQLVCIELQEGANLTYTKNSTLRKGRDVKRLVNFVPIDEYKYLERLIFIDNEEKACLFGRLVHKNRAFELGKSSGYAFAFEYAVPEGEAYTLVCGNAEPPKVELKHKGSHSFFDSAGNGCVFSGFPVNNKSLSGKK